MPPFDGTRTRDPAAKIEMLPILTLNNLPLSCSTSGRFLRIFAHSASKSASSRLSSFSMMPRFQRSSPSSCTRTLTPSFRSATLRWFTAIAAHAFRMIGIISTESHSVASFTYTAGHGYSQPSARSIRAAWSRQRSSLIAALRFASFREGTAFTTMSEESAASSS